MATEDDDYDGDPLSGGSFTQLLESDDLGPGPYVEGGLFRPSSPSHDGSHEKMLCFGYQGEIGFFEAARVQLVVGQKTGMSAGNSCSTSSSSGFSKSRKAGKAGGGGEGGKMEERGGVLSGSEVCATAESSRNAVKKAKTKPGCSSSSSTHRRPSKAKKEKLGERITALQKLVSPYGKTDTASVLHEAMGYIRFLHDQVQVLSSPYLQRLPRSSAKLQQEEKEEGGEAESRCDLRSRGLCLVPVECTVHVARSNGADLWSPAMATNTSNR